MKDSPLPIGWGEGMGEGISSQLESELELGVGAVPDLIL